MRILTKLLIMVFFAGALIFAYNDPARKMVPTCYSDGAACPGGCDSHVVFDGKINGTRNAFDPDGGRDNPQKCRRGRPCRICFAEEDSSCINVTYRGPGPEEGIFDFTPAFYQQNCDKSDLPEPLAQVCRDMGRRVEMLKRRTNCFETPDDPKCSEMMNSAAKRKAADQPYFDECRKLGETAFNFKYKDQPQLQRTWGCTYEMNGTGSSQTGSDRKLLLPAACGQGSYVGREGLDCCSSDLMTTALLQRECDSFFPRK